MAITVVRRPQGHKLSNTQVSAEASDSSGDALFTTDSYHTLTTGDYIYVDSTIQTYNGFKYVEVESLTSFKTRASENSAVTPYKQDADVFYRVSIVEHGFQCVHLPIVYELASDLFPIDEPGQAYTPNTVTSFSDNNGYVQIETSESIADPVELLKIRLVGDGPLAGVYQITDVNSPWSVVIDLVYDADYDFGGYTIVKYYDNYTINVNIYAGLSSGHRWEDEKTISLVATKKFIPDSNNRALFAIDDILRGYVTTVNNLALDTLPNNIDFMVEFYIGYYQSYDDVNEDGELYTLTDDETVDDFIGQAINAKNEFKNQYSGYLSDYVSDGNTLARWLTDFERPLAFVGYFFDLSFLAPENNQDIEVTIIKKLLGDQQATETISIENPGRGVIRVPITAESGYDEYCIQATALGESGDTLPMVIESLSDWVNISGSDTDWTTGAAPSVVVPGTVGSPKSDKLASDYGFISGVEYSITVDYTRTNPGFYHFYILILDSSNNILHTKDDLIATSGSSTPDSATITFTANGNEAKISVRSGPQVNLSPTSSTTIVINSVSGTYTTPDTEDMVITEEICIGIVDECESTFAEDIRELEDGTPRLLE